MGRFDTSIGVVLLAEPAGDPIPRGDAALGYTIQRPLNRAELMNRMTLRLGGRAAESLAFDEVSTVQPAIRRKRLRSPTAWWSGSVFDPYARPGRLRARWLTPAALWRGDRGSDRAASYLFAISRLRPEQRLVIGTDNAHVRLSNPC